MDNSIAKYINPRSIVNVKSPESIESFYLLGGAKYFDGLFSLPLFEGELSKEDAKSLFVSINEIKQKEELFLTAIRNYYKINNFLKLTNQLSEKMINDDEYEKEIVENEDKYVVQMNKELDQQTLNIISRIVEKLGIEYTVDEVAEIFSIMPEEINKLSELIKD